MGEAAERVEVMRRDGWIRVINRGDRVAVIPCAWPPGAVDMVHPGRWLIRRNPEPGRAGHYVVGSNDMLTEIPTFLR